jgi:hypothetical protein
MLTTVNNLPFTGKMLSVDTNAKTIKGQAYGYMTGIMYFAPARKSGFNVCASSTPSCEEGCLYSAGRGAFNSVQLSRLAKTRFYFEDRPAFMARLIRAIARLVAKAKRGGFVPVVRLNGTSDIPWERVRFAEQTIFDLFPGVQFYDYSKITKRAIAWANGDMPQNYHLTFSRSGDNDEAVEQVLAAGGNVAMVFSKDAYKAVLKAGEYQGRPVLDGDKSDLRFADPSGHVVALKAKGPARQNVSSFVIQELESTGY